MTCSVIIVRTNFNTGAVLRTKALICVSCQPSSISELKRLTAALIPQYWGIDAIG